MICALKLIIKTHYGIKCIINLLHLQPYDDMFKMISDIMTYWYDLWNTIVIPMNLEKICA